MWLPSFPAEIRCDEEPQEEVIEDKDDTSSISDIWLLVHASWFLVRTSIDVRRHLTPCGSMGELREILASFGTGEWGRRDAVTVRVPIFAGI